MFGTRTAVGVLAAGFVIATAIAGDDRAAAMSLVDVTGADGMPAKGAMVTAVPMSGFEMHGEWSEPLREFSMTDANGRAALPSQSNHVCLFAFLGDQAALRCAVKDVSSVRATPIYELRLEPAKTISGRVLGADGKPVAGVRLRLAIAGGQEWHYLDAEIAEDGRF